MCKLTLTAGLFLVIASLASSQRLVCYYNSDAENRAEDGKLTVSDLNPMNCTHLIYAFSDIANNMLVPSKPTDLQNYQLFNELKASNSQLKTLLAVGGLTFDKHKFSTMVESKDNRTQFIESAIKLLRDNGFDGLNLDWRFPVQTGSSTQNKQRFTLLCQELREAFEEEAKQSNRDRLLVTASVSAEKATIDTSYEVTLIARHLDFINVLTFDFHGPWQNVTGHHSPLFKGAEDIGDRVFLNTDFAMKYWLSKGASAGKLNLGLAAYGRAFNLSTASSAVGAPANGPGEEGCYTGEEGFWASYETCLYLEGVTILTIPDQKVPYATTENQWVGFDNKDSLCSKVTYLKDNNYGGAFVWSLDLDDTTGQFCKMGNNPFISHLHNLLVSGCPKLTTSAPTTTLPATTTTTPPTTTTSAPTTTTTTTTTTPPPTTTTTTSAPTTTTTTTATPPTTTTTTAPPTPTTTTAPPTTTTTTTPTTTPPTTTTTKAPPTTTTTTAPLTTTTTTTPPTTTTTTTSPTTTTTTTPPTTTTTTTPPTTTTTTTPPTTTTTTTPPTTTTTTTPPTTTTTTTPPTTTTTTTPPTTTPPTTTTTTTPPTTTTTTTPPTTTTTTPPTTTTTTPPTTTTTTTPPTTTTTTTPPTTTTTTTAPTTTTTTTPPTTTTTTTPPTTTTTTAPPTTTTTTTPPTTTTTTTPPTTTPPTTTTTTTPPTTTTTTTPPTTTTSPTTTTTTTPPTTTTTTSPTTTTTTTPPTTTTTTIPPTTLTTRSPNPSDLCNGRQAGHFPHPTDPHKFVQCDHGKPHIGTCKDNLKFDVSCKCCNNI